MNVQQAIENRKKNEQAVITSALIAKAVIRMNDGSMRVLAVYDQSTRYEFYWTHTPKTKTPRAARKSWGKGQQAPRDFNADYKPYTDLRSFADHYAKLHHGTVLSVRVYKARRMAALLVHTDHESCSTDWNFAASMNSSDPNDFKYINRKLDAKIKGRDTGWGL